ncbi:DUF2474 domain-containing protein [Paraburkholderia sp.]|uniref:DUF2474 domain-containing protein n=1 Tax=Paraburkholderia sp. TaxID=1926495 RepID=UPI0023A4FFD5|nr:DUF2474 domain-containing protein [Paraburkholderia sp.]MDE1181796.1 DUF2474 domain-containing protein [Paraburkholderia sp.]
MDRLHSPNSRDPAAGSPFWKRCAWLVGIWFASVSVVLIVVELLKLFMAAAGLKTH